MWVGEGAAFIANTYPNVAPADRVGVSRDVSPSWVNLEVELRKCARLEERLARMALSPFPSVADYRDAHDELSARVNACQKALGELEKRVPGPLELEDRLERNFYQRRALFSQSSAG